MPAREPCAVREVEITVTGGELPNVQNSSADAENLQGSLVVTEAAYQSSASSSVQSDGTVTAASLSSPPMSSSSPDVKGSSQAAFYTFDVMPFLQLCSLP